MSDLRITCKRCGRPFIWSYGEQRYYQERRLHQPKHCPACRVARKSEIDGLDLSRQRGDLFLPRSRRFSFDVPCAQIGVTTVAVVIALVVLWWLFF